MKIAILDMYDGVPNEGMRCIKHLVRQFSENAELPVFFEVFDVRKTYKVPVINDFDAFISSGGPGNPVEYESTWAMPWFNLLDNIKLHNQRYSSKKYLLLICHSFQMACHHWNLAQISKRKSVSFGIFPLHRLIDNEYNEPLFDGLPDPFWVVDSREYQVLNLNTSKLMAGNSNILCIEKLRPHVLLEQAIMAIRFTTEIFGTQFHPEADADGMLRYFLKEEKKESIIKTHGLAKYLDMIRHLNDPDKIMLTESIIIPNFLKQVAKQFLELP